MEQPNNIAMDSIQYASEIGRLDFVSALLAAIAIIMAFGGLYAFINIRDKAIKIAQDTAEEKAERIANEYLVNNLPLILEAYDDFIQNHVNDSVANQIAQSQEGEKDE